jgi:hypothetical protein
MSEKSARKPAKPRGKPFPKGQRDPRQGNGPAKGAENAGRPPDWWKAQMRELRDRFLIAAQAAEVIDNPDHPQWAKVGTWVHEQLEGKAKTSVDVTSKGESLSDLLTAIAQRTRESR